MRVCPTTAVAARITTIMGTMVTNLLPDTIYLHRANMRTHGRLSHMIHWIPS